MFGLRVSGIQGSSDAAIAIQQEPECMKCTVVTSAVVRVVIIVARVGGGDRDRRRPQSLRSPLVLNCALDAAIL